MGSCEGSSGANEAKAQEVAEGFLQPYQGLNHNRFGPFFMEGVHESGGHIRRQPKVLARDFTAPV